VNLIGRNDKEIFVPADRVIFAIGQIPNTQTFENVRSRVEECYLIGAARIASEANAQAAIWEAAEVANRI
jgi:hypothetical protein